MGKHSKGQGNKILAGMLGFLLLSSFSVLEEQNLRLQHPNIAEDRGVSLVAMWKMPLGLHSEICK